MLVVASGIKRGRVTVILMIGKLTFKVHHTSAVIYQDQNPRMRVPPYNLATIVVQIHKTRLLEDRNRRHACYEHVISSRGWSASGYWIYHETVKFIYSYI